MATMAMELSHTLPVYRATCSSNPPASRASRSLAMATLAENNNDSKLSDSSSSSSIPKMEPFNRSRVSRLIKEPSLLERAEHAISDRCSILEGDEAYQCWETLFEFENLKDEYTGQCTLAEASERQTACRPLERFENFVRQSGGAASLIDNVRVLAMAKKMHKSSDATTEEGMHAKSIDVMHADDNGHIVNFKGVDGLTHADGNGENVHVFPESGALPQSKEELEWEKNALMPESPFTRVLRTFGIPAPWYGQQSS